jgi:hypothetical protein
MYNHPLFFYLSFSFAFSLSPSPPLSPSLLSLSPLSPFLSLSLSPPPFSSLSPLPPFSLSLSLSQGHENTNVPLILKVRGIFFCLGQNIFVLPAIKNNHPHFQNQGYINSKIYSEFIFCVRFPTEVTKPKASLN